MLRPLLNETVSYLWQDGSANNYFNVTTPGIYRLYTTNKCGTATDEIEIISGLCLLEMPNSFTPNNDGLNDLFRVKYPEFIKDFHMIIYNRWGQEIFETNNPVIGWDGTYKSNPQGNGTYIWTITLTDIQNHNQTSKGTITLIR